jgi:catechol 2,3-dioxygenase-like lactoylglutathione lyase family enzyme
VIGRLHHVVIDCADPKALAEFYSELIGLPITYTSEDWVVVAVNDTSSGIAFQLAVNHTPPDWPDAKVPQQFHLDIMVDDIEDAAPKVLRLGGRRLSGDVFADPAGHPFCLVHRPPWATPISDSQPPPGR